MENKCLWFWPQEEIYHPHMAKKNYYYTPLQMRRLWNWCRLIGCYGGSWFLLQKNVLITLEGIPYLSLIYLDTVYTHVTITFSVFSVPFISIIIRATYAIFQNVYQNKSLTFMCFAMLQPRCIKLGVHNSVVCYHVTSPRGVQYWRTAIYICLSCYTLRNIKK